MLIINNIVRLKVKFGDLVFGHGYTTDERYVLYAYQKNVFTHIITIDRNETMMNDFAGNPVSGYTVKVFDDSWKLLHITRTWDFILKDKDDFFSKFPFIIEKYANNK